MKILTKAFLAAAVAGAFAVGPANAAVVIDLFTDPVLAAPQVASDTTVGGGGAASSHIGANIIGGERDLYAETISAAFLETETSLKAGGGFLAFSQGSGVTGKGIVQWDGADGSSALDKTGLGGADLTLCGVACNQFTTTVFQADFGFGYAITVVDMDGDEATLTASTQFPVAAPTGANYLFSWFNLADADGYFLGGLLFNIDRVDAADGVIDFSNIGALQFEINVPFGGDDRKVDIDLTIGAITTRVPEPGALALVGIALVGAAVAGRRRKTLSA